jgi:radical SAM protein with 4Fe4S-binding SPASM domain
MSARPAMPTLGQRPDFERAPVIVIWEATRACALACRHCRAEAVPRRDPRELADAEARAMLAHIRAEFGPILVVLTGGDPLERRGILGLAAYGASLGLRLGITPAVTPRLDGTMLSAIQASGIRRLALSLDGADAATHDGFRGVPGTFDATLRALDQARERGLDTQVNTTIGVHDHHQLEAIARLVAEHGAVQWSVFITVPTGRAAGGDLLDAAGHERLYRRLAAIALDPATPFTIKTTAGQPYYRVLAQRAAARGAALPPRLAAGVNDGNGFVFVSHLGAICPSGFLPIEAGNVRTHSLAEVYRAHPVFRRLRQPATFTGKCARCSYQRVCGGSRSRTHALTGDPFGSDPTCAYHPPLVGAAQATGCPAG